MKNSSRPQNIDHSLYNINIADHEQILYLATALPNMICTAFVLNDYIITVIPLSCEKVFFIEDFDKSNWKLCPDLRLNLRPARIIILIE